MSDIPPLRTTEAERSWGGTLPHLAALVGRGGHVALGLIAPIEDAAVASDATRLYATLLRREGETLDRPSIPVRAVTLSIHRQRSNRVHRVRQYLSVLLRFR
jgi:hypothetical protein